MPQILCGIYDYVAEIMQHYPGAEIIHPERMLDFTKWLSAMEKADGVVNFPVKATIEK